MNIDRLQRFPNQTTEKRYNECVGETVADIVGNIFNQPMDAGFSKACALKVANEPPTSGGTDSYSGMVGATIYGCMPTDDVPFDVNVYDELYESNINNYSPRTLAVRFHTNTVKSFYSYNDISQYLSQNKMGVQLTVKWYESFNTPNQDGTLPAPTGSFSYHCVAVYEDTLLGLRVKPWLGSEFGYGGYCYMSRITFGLSFISSSGFDPNANRWMWLARTAVTHLNLLPDILPLLKSA